MSAGAPADCASLRPTPGDGLAILGLQKLAHQSGTQLMHQIEREFPQTHKFVLFTGSRSAGNIRPYERLGYARVREQPLSPATTLVFMEEHR
jgi:hypothetical protein